MIDHQALHHHIQRLLQRDLGMPLAEADGDGDYGSIIDGHIVWVRPLLGESPALVRVWTPAAHGVKRSAALLKEINELNTGLNQVRCFLVESDVMISAEMELESVEAGELGRLVTRVGETAEHIGELITTVFGGHPPFAVGIVGDDEDEYADDVEPQADG